MSVAPTVAVTAIPSMVGVWTGKMGLVVAQFTVTRLAKEL